jgi:hypothetical protein
MGGEGAWDHINSCLYHASNWTCAHEHVLRALESICNDAGFATRHKRVLTSEGNRRADLEVRNICVSQQTDLLIDVTVRQKFKGTGLNGQTQLRNPDNPDHILESAAADKIRNYRFFLSNKQAEDYFAALGYQAHKKEFCHRRGVFFQQNWGTIGMACAQAAALRGARTTAHRTSLTGLRESSVYRSRHWPLQKQSTRKPARLTIL